MANEVVSLANLQRFKGKCDNTYAKKLYWHTITVTATSGATCNFTFQCSIATALTKNNLKNLFGTPKYVNGVYFDTNDDFPLLTLKVDAILRLHIQYYDMTNWAVADVSPINSNSWSYTDVVEAVL